MLLKDLIDLKGVGESISLNFSGSRKIINSILNAWCNQEEERRQHQLNFVLDKFHISSKIVLTSKCQVRHRASEPPEH